MREEKANEILTLMLKAIDDKELTLEDKSVVNIFVNKTLTQGYDNTMNDLLDEGNFYNVFGFTYNYPMLVTKFLMSDYYNNIREILLGGE